MPYREEMKKLFKQVEEENRDKLEQVVGQLRKEFDTLHRICRLLMEDIEAIDSKLSDTTPRELMDATHKVGGLMTQVIQHEERIRQIEILLMSSSMANSAISIVNAGGQSTSVGGDVGNDVVVK